MLSVKNAPAPRRSAKKPPGAAGLPSGRLLVGRSFGARCGTAAFYRAKAAHRAAFRARRRAAGAVQFSACVGGAGVYSGSSNQKVLPCPTMLVTP